MASCEDLENEIRLLSGEIDVMRMEYEDLDNKETANPVTCDDILFRLSETSFRRELAQLAAAGEASAQDSKRREGYDKELLGALRAFTGLGIEQATCTAIPPDETIGRGAKGPGSSISESWGRSRYSIQGASYGLPFLAAFDFHERVLRIENLRVFIPPFTPPELAPFVKCTEQECSLRTFFKGFARFAELAAERASLFRSVLSSAPRRKPPAPGKMPPVIPTAAGATATATGQVLLTAPGADAPRNKRARKAQIVAPGGSHGTRSGEEQQRCWVLAPFGAGSQGRRLCGYSDTLVIAPPSSRCQLYFTWKLSVAPDGGVSQKFDLVPRVSGVSEDSCFVEGIAKRFRDVCALAGPAAALRAVLRCTLLSAE